MLRLGLTGGIGAGKSTVATVLTELGGVLVDSDVLAREVVEPGTPGLQQLTETFGTDILAPDGSLDRPALAAKAFGDEESRKKLNAIVHPLVGKRTAEIIDGAARDAVVVQDIPLLVEGSMGPFFQLVVVVWVDAEERVRRLTGQRNMSEADARARIAAQATDDARRVAADVWIDNTGAPGSVDEQVRALWNERLIPFERNIRERVVARTHPELATADPAWESQARRIIGRLALACGDKAVRIDHVGSTAVPGLDAKNVIDIQITVRGLDDADAVGDQLCAAGFPGVEASNSDEPKPAYGIGGEADPAVWGKRFHGSADPGRPANVHLRVDGWPNQKFALLFRDWLRAETGTATEYAGIKRRASEAAAGITDYRSAIEAYENAKAPWFDVAYRRAWQWAADTGWSS
ncbi:Dephospho-CoA kinase [Rhodococcus sp. AW25M09]|uniref:dephospho-CoA kinase n=1 Tax=Rhodococcus sp. AW25M09 TaxID=1268303 RepID=UPI0002AC1E58|nr:dephospho-CoA kinase [Rhodococcus sp. AW25M09]CCQ16282.1 Dephospho-CoA kinase [Rhodococcus sp. AW25M09]